MSIFKGLNKRHEDPKFDYIINILEEINKRMDKSPVDNREEWARHMDIEHHKIENWQNDHIGQKDDTPHAIIGKRLSSHSKRFWWLSGVGVSIGTGITFLIEWWKK